MKIRGKKLIIVFAIILLLGVITFFGVRYLNKESFSVNNILIKLTMPIGSESISNLKINNQEDTEQNFKITFNNLGGIVSTITSEFTVGPKDSREIQIYFKDSKQKVGVYFGQIVIETPKLSKKIPTIIEIEETNPFYAITQSSMQRYDTIFPGGKLGINMKIFNLMDTNSHHVRVTYNIQNSDGEIIFFEEENLIIRESLETSKIVDLPKTFSVGEYLFTIHIKGEHDESISGYLFKISEKKNEFFSGNLLFFSIIIIAFLIGILIMFFYLIRSRDALLIKLSKQQDIEVKRNLDVTKRYKRQIDKEKSKPIKKAKIKAFKASKKKAIKEIHAKQKKQKQQVKRLKKKGAKNTMKDKIKTWEKQGYKIPKLEEEMKKIAQKDFGRQIKNLKKQGYKTDVLGK